MKKETALIVSDEDLADPSKGYSFFNLKPEVYKIAVKTKFVFFNGVLVKNFMGVI